MKEHFSALRNRVKVVAFQMNDLAAEIATAGNKCFQLETELAAYKTENGQLETILKAYQQLLREHAPTEWTSAAFDEFERKALE